jgi:hypothetical protein
VRHGHDLADSLVTTRTAEIGLGLLCACAPALNLLVNRLRGVHSHASPNTTGGDTSISGVELSIKRRTPASRSPMASYPGGPDLDDEELLRRNGSVGLSLTSSKSIIMNAYVEELCENTSADTTPERGIVVERNVHVTSMHMAKSDNGYETGQPPTWQDHKAV